MPLSTARWTDPYQRFQPFGTPPAKQGDYAYLLHIVRSLKSTGKGACILPHGVLFRGNVEADIRRALVRKGYIKGIIGLPANLFYGTGITLALSRGRRTRAGSTTKPPARGVIAPAQVGTKKRSCGRTKKLTGSKMAIAASR
jgi:hypothetical protein